MVMLVFLEKDGPARVAGGACWIGGDGGHGFVERGEHMQVGSPCFTYKIDDSLVTQGWA